MSSDAEVKRQLKSLEASALLLSSLREMVISNPERVVQALSNLLAMYGASEKWDVEILEWTADELNRLVSPVKLPEVSDQSPKALKFWRRIADRRSIDHD